jgi:hypothetical protein
MSYSRTNRRPDPVLTMNRHDPAYYRNERRWEPNSPVRSNDHVSAQTRRSARGRFQDAIEYQFWPTRIAMGTGIGKQFVQVGV